MLLCFVCWLLKDWISYPWLKLAYQAPPSTGAEALVGNKGIAEDDLTPQGFIRVRGERGRALASPMDFSIRAGSKVEIMGAERMTIFVRAVH